MSQPKLLTNNEFLALYSLASESVRRGENSRWVAEFGIDMVRNIYWFEGRHEFLQFTTPLSPLNIYSVASRTKAFYMVPEEFVYVETYTLSNGRDVRVHHLSRAGPDGGFKYIFLSNNDSRQAIIPIPGDSDISLSDAFRQ